ncbi:uncharacterized protein N7473_004646 [Penicillium subrubescens]|uniref:uncharacterized protein n=1 Tax=Penicillium subrubescens TaxID=1316194 RepID=UPI002544F258|nr:uncharacterized protein N7473_004646 [Penicillium subrubescens]KAJ5900576.1 hypothetical protein N7473_004646 [Penicillium subrubescens]
MATSVTSWSRLRAPASSLIYSRPTYDIRRTSPAFAKARGNVCFSSSTPSDTASPVATFRPAGRLSGRTCMVTGGTSGIGFAIAERFMQEGALTIILVGRSQERLQKAAEKLSIIDGTETSSDKVRLVVGDVGKAGTWMRELEKEMAGVDVLVNAAGISISKILPKLELDDISQVLRTNLEGAILTSRAFLRAAIRSRIRDRKNTDSGQKPPSKCIINVSSLLALKAGSGAVPYAASKAGLLGLTRSLAVESSTSMRDLVVRSNAIVPGYIETPMIEDFSLGEVDRLKALIPLRRFGDPREIADAAVFLAQNEYANNCVLNLDGGLSAV